MSLRNSICLQTKIAWILHSELMTTLSEITRRTETRIGLRK